MPFERVGILANAGKVSSRSVVREAVKLIIKSGRQVICDEATAVATGVDIPRCEDALALSRKVDLILVCGGDGTMLRAARELRGARTPLLGINVGALGFLTDVPSTGLPRALEQLWRGEFTVDQRALMEVVGLAGDRAVRAVALNDFVISHGVVSRLIEVEVSVDGEVLTIYRGDGLIVSSPTGSTAYSLSAGGAVVSPNAEVFSLTPICPNTLSNRAVIIPLSSQIDVKIVSERLETVLSGDGSLVAELNPGDTIRICRSRDSARFIHLAGTSFFQTLRHKLHWRGSTI